MKPWKKILIGLIICFLAIQFFQPERNNGKVDLPTDFITSMRPPQEVQSILITSCYDCHSNRTNYPWYTHVQPVGWFMAGHIKKGKAELNFSEFGSYTSRRQKNKLKLIESAISKSEMPISSYTLLHKNAKLTTDQRKLMKDWLSQAIDSLSKTR